MLSGPCCFHAMFHSTCCLQCLTGAGYRTNHADRTHCDIDRSMANTDTSIHCHPELAQVKDQERDINRLTLVRLPAPS